MQYLDNDLYCACTRDEIETALKCGKYLAMKLKLDQKLVLDHLELCTRECGMVSIYTYCIQFTSVETIENSIVFMVYMYMYIVLWIVALYYLVHE